MADRTSNAPDGPDFLRMLGWTVLLSLVFSAGLIIGEQVLRRNGRAPVVDTSGPSALSTEAKDPDETPPPETEPETPETVYSFYEKLSEGDESDQSDPTGESGGSGASRHPAAKFTLQVGAHPTLEAAEAQMRELEKLGLDPYLATSTLDGDEKYYRVRIGKFPTEKEAKSLERRLDGREGLDAFVTSL